jgi:inorganic pyrophosphatase
MNLKKIKIGSNVPDEFNVVIEIRRGTSVKYEIDNKTGELKANRVIGSALVYPFDYGYISETLADDGDALDVILLSDNSIKPAVLARPIGVLVMSDEHGRDEKILAVDANSVGRDFDNLSLQDREKIELFFKQYKEMEKSRWSKVYDFGDKAQAINIVKRCVAKYRKNG